VGAPPDRGEVSPVEVAMRAVAAAAILIGGLVHLDLYFRYGYRDFPNDNLGRSFLLNGFASVVVAAALLLRRDAIIRILGIVLVVGTLGAFFMSRNLDNGIFGFTEKGWEPSPQAALAFIAEIVALVVLVASFVPALQWRQQAVVNTAVGATLALIVVAIGIAAPAVWARTDDTTTASDTTYAASTTVDPPATSTTVDPPATSTGATTTAGAATTAAGATTAPATTAAAAGAGQAVTIKGFAFDPADLQVKVGDSVTWTNEDGATHDVSADDGSFASGDLDKGAAFSQTFTTAGSFSYICSIHPRMKATVTVTG